MNTRKLWTLIAAPGLAVTSLLLAFLLLGQSTVGAAFPIGNPQITIVPSTPTTNDTVQITVSGEWFDSCVPEYQSHQLVGSVITIDTVVFLPPGTACLEVVTPWQITAEIGKLLAGSYTVRVLPFGTEVTTSFTVGQSHSGLCSRVWVIETVDSEGNVGAQTSLALEPAYPYIPHISYHADPSGDASGDMFVKHAWFNGTTWLSETVDFGCGSTSLALVPTDPHTPSISYDGCQRRTKFARLAGTTWYSNTVPGLDADGSSLALELTDPYTPHISYFWALGSARNLWHAYLSGTIWMSGTWVQEPVEPSGSNKGTWSSLALDPTYPYTPHVSYYDRSNDDLKYAWLSGTTWLTETVDSAGDVGWYTSLALDSSGDPHISYFDYTNDALNLKYAWLSGTTWLSETVDSIGEPPYGSGYSLELDQADAPYISYYDAINNDLKLAHLSGTVWITQTVDSEGDVGSWSSLALDQVDCPHISYYDATNGDLKYAHRQYVVYLPIIIKNWSPT